MGGSAKTGGTVTERGRTAALSGRGAGYGGEVRQGRVPLDPTLVCRGKAVLLWMTNLPRAAWSAEQVMSLYRCRWQVELLFKEWKSHNRLKGFVTGRKPSPRDWCGRVCCRW
ncbi:transposase [Aeromonas caviae]|uniref:transposase n=1 Tax=Aeromonas caviae TaxID=648 RepID=UPI003B585CBA